MSSFKYNNCQKFVCVFFDTKFRASRLTFQKTLEQEIGDISLTIVE